MKLSRRMTLVLVLLATVVLAALQIFEVTRELRLASLDTQHDHLLLGHTLAGSLSRAWQRDGEAEALTLLDQANRFEDQVQVRWLWLDREPLPFPPEAMAPLKSDQAVSLVNEKTWPGVRATYTPVSINGRRGAIEVSESLAAEALQVRRTVIGSVLATAAMATLFMIAAALLGQWMIGKPVRKLSHLAARIGSGDFSARVWLPNADELTDLATSINQMSDALLESRKKLEAETIARLATLEHLRHADRLATVGKLAAGVAHELGTPINVIHGRARMIEKGELQGQSPNDSARIIAEQAQSMTKIIRQLLDFARRRVPARAPQDLRQLVEKVLVLLRPLAVAKQVKLELVPGEVRVAEVDAGQFEQVITNLVVNGFQAMSKPGSVRVEIHSERRSPPTDAQGAPLEWVRIDVEDSGSGISPEVLPKIFEPFFTTKDVGEGTGLGLSVVYGMVHEHGGWVAVKSEPQQGSVFSVYLPLLMSAGAAR